MTFKLRIDINYEHVTNAKKNGFKEIVFCQSLFEFSNFILSY